MSRRWKLPLTLLFAAAIPLAGRVSAAQSQDVTVLWSALEQDDDNLVDKFDLRDEQRRALEQRTKSAEADYRACDALNGAAQPKQVVRQADESRKAAEQGRAGIEAERLEKETKRRQLERQRHLLIRRWRAREINWAQYSQQLVALERAYRVQYIQPMNESVLVHYDAYMEVAKNYLTLATQAATACRTVTAPIQTVDAKSPDPQTHAAFLSDALLTYQQSVLQFADRIKQILVRRSS